MLKKTIFHIALTVGVLLAFTPGYAQKNKKNAQVAPGESSDAQLIKDAEKLFKDGDYTTAFPMYSQILSLHPRDFNYNFRFGVCQLFVNEDPEKAITSLEYASKYPKMDNQVYFYLGRAYHLNYKFDEAIRCYEHFKAKASSSQQKSFDIDLQIAMCYNAKQLMSSISDLYVIQHKDVSKNGFFRSYEFDDIGGMLLAKSADFQTSVDKKNEGENALMYIPKDRKYIYYSSYGRDEKNGKDIYRVKKMDDGKWGDPENLGSVINTKYDEDYPYVSTDGKTLYFSSKGHNSMGGYDIFRSTWDSINNKWSQPENLDFAINTPYDDYMFIPDINEHYAFFASGRSVASNMASLYKVRIDRRPRQKEAVAVAKEIEQSYVNNDTVKLIEAIKVIKQKAKMPVNASEERFARYDTPAESAAKVSTIDVAKVNAANNYEETKYKKKYAYDRKESDYPEIQITEKSSNQDIINSTKVETLKLQNELDAVSYKSKAATQVVEDINSDISDNVSETLKLKTESESETDISKKELLLKRADSIQKETESLKKEVAVASSVAKQLEQKKKTKQSEVDQSAKFVKELETAMNSKSTKDIINILDDYNKQQENQPVDDAQIVNQISPTQNDYSVVKSDAEKLESVTHRIKDDLDEVNASIEKIEKDIQNTHKKDTKTTLQDQLNNQKTEKEDLESKYKTAKNKSDVAMAQADSLKSQIAFNQGVYDNILATADSNYITDSKKTPKPTVEQQIKNMGIKGVSKTPSQPIAVKSTEPANSTSGIQTNANNNVDVLKKQYDNFNNQYNAALFIAKSKGDEAQRLVNEADNGSGDQTEKRRKAKALSESSIASAAVAEYYKSKSTDAKKLYDDAVDVKLEIARNLAKNDLKTAKDLLFEQEDIIQFNQDKLNSSLSVDEIVKNAAKVKTEDAKAKQNGTISLNNEILHMRTDNDNAKEELSGKKVSDERKEELKLQIALTEKDIVEKERELKTKIQDATTTASSAEVLAVYNPSELKTEIVQKTGTVKNQDVAGVNEKVVAANATSTNKSTKEVANKDFNSKGNADNSKVKESVSDVTANKSANEIAKSDLSSNDNVDNAKVKKSSEEPNTEIAQNVESPMLDKNSTVEKSESKKKQESTKVQSQQRDVKAAQQDSIITVMLGEFVITAQAYKKQYEDKKIKLDDVRIDAADPELTTKYSDAESIITASQLEKGANENIAKVLENMRLSETENDKKTKLDMLAEANKLGEQIIADQSKAIELYQRGRSSAALAQKLDANNESKKEKSLIEPKTKTESETKTIDNQNNSSANSVSAPIESESSVNKDAGMDEFEKIAAKNKALYLGNKTKLESISRANLEPDVVKMTSELVDDADVYFETAQGKRNDVSKSSDKNKKTEMLVQANEYEKISLMKQNQALEILNSKASMAQVVDKQLNNAGQYEIKKPEDKPAVSTEANSTVQPTGTVAPNNQEIAVNNAKIEADKKAQKERDAKKSADDKANAKKIAAEEAKAKAKQLADDKKAKQLADAQAKLASKQIADAKAKEKAELLAVNAAKSKSTQPSSNSVASKPTNIRTSSNVAELLENQAITGLCYKVQVAAFKGDVRFGMFNNVSPISTENTATGFTRVMAGVFVDFKEADKAKETARQKGYKDAFVVAYLNGKRIKIVDAKIMKDSVKIKESKIDFNAPIVYAPEGVETVKIDPASILNNQKNIEQVKGEFFTIQVGVYSKPVLLENIYDLKDVYFEKLPNGLIRYSAGVYKTKEECIAAKSSVVGKGIKDAFVAEYKDGKRVSIIKPDVKK